jgi:N-acetyltransferase
MNFQCGDDYILQNESVLLRPLIHDDIPYLIPFALTEPSLWTYSLKTAAGDKAMIEYVEDAINARRNHREYTFIVFDKKTGSYAGSTRFYDIQPVSDTVQLGFTWYGKDFQGTGLNKHCKYLLLEFAFEKMGVHRVEFRADYRNKRSIAAMKSLGCIEEGILRSNGYCADGSRRDSIVLSILNNEWYADVKKNIFSKLVF